MMEWSAGIFLTQMQRKETEGDSASAPHTWIGPGPQAPGEKAGLLPI